MYSAGKPSYPSVVRNSITSGDTSPMDEDVTSTVVSSDRIFSSVPYNEKVTIDTRRGSQVESMMDTSEEQNAYPTLAGGTKVSASFDRRMFKIRNDLQQLASLPAITAKERFLLLEAKDRYIRLSIERNTAMREAGHTKGTCPDMCPEKERYLREWKGMVPFFERPSGGRKGIMMDHSKAIKQYSRGNADDEPPLPHELRAEHVLGRTMHFLLAIVVDECDTTEDAKVIEWFNYVCDRTRAIRKDIAQQDLCSQTVVKLMEQCARFHIHCAALLVDDEPSPNYQRNNTENLADCLQTLKRMYAVMERRGEPCSGEADFRAYLLLLHLNDENFLYELQQMPSTLVRAPEIQFALSLHSALTQHNYVRFFELVQATNYMNACITHRYFTQVRENALSLMRKAYSSRITTRFPLAHIIRILSFEDEEDAQGFFDHYGVSVNRESGMVILEPTIVAYQPECPYWNGPAMGLVAGKRICSVAEAICGEPLDRWAAQFPFAEWVSSFDAQGYLRKEILRETLDKEVEAPCLPTNVETTTPSSMPVVARKSVKRIQRTKFFDAVMQNTFSNDKQRPKQSTDFRQRPWNSPRQPEQSIKSSDIKCVPIGEENEVIQVDSDSDEFASEIPKQNEKKIGDHLKKEPEKSALLQRCKHPTMAQEANRAMGDVFPKEVPEEKNQHANTEHMLTEEEQRPDAESVGVSESNNMALDCSYEAISDEEDSNMSRLDMDTPALTNTKCVENDLSIEASSNETTAEFRDKTRHADQNRDGKEKDESETVLQLQQNDYKTLQPPVKLEQTGDATLDILPDGCSNDANMELQDQPEHTDSNQLGKAKDKSEKIQLQQTDFELLQSPVKMEHTADANLTDLPDDVAFQDARQQSECEDLQCIAVEEIGLEGEQLQQGTAAKESNDTCNASSNEATAEFQDQTKHADGNRIATGDESEAVQRQQNDSTIPQSSATLQQSADCIVTEFSDGSSKVINQEAQQQNRSEDPQCIAVEEIGLEGEQLQQGTAAGESNDTCFDLDIASSNEVTVEFQYQTKHADGNPIATGDESEAVQRQQNDSTIPQSSATLQQSADCIVTEFSDGSSKVTIQEAQEQNRSEHPQCIAVEDVGWEGEQLQQGMVAGEGNDTCFDLDIASSNEVTVEFQYQTKHADGNPIATGDESEAVQRQQDDSTIPESSVTIQQSADCIVTEFSDGSSKVTIQEAQEQNRSEDPQCIAVEDVGWEGEQLQQGMVAGEGNDTCFDLDIAPSNEVTVEFQYQTKHEEIGWEGEQLQQGMVAGEGNDTCFDLDIAPSNEVTVEFQYQTKHEDQNHPGGEKDETKTVQLQQNDSSIPESADELEQTVDAMLLDFCDGSLNMAIQETRQQIGTEDPQCIVMEEVGLQEEQLQEHMVVEAGNFTSFDQHIDSKIHESYVEMEQTVDAMLIDVFDDSSNVQEDREQCGSEDPQCIVMEEVELQGEQLPEHMVVEEVTFTGSDQQIDSAIPESSVEIEQTVYAMLIDMFDDYSNATIQGDRQESGSEDPQCIVMEEVGLQGAQLHEPPECEEVKNIGFDLCDDSLNEVTMKFLDPTKHAEQNNLATGDESETVPVQQNDSTIPESLVEMEQAVDGIVIGVSDGSSNVIILEDRQQIGSEDPECILMEKVEKQEEQLQEPSVSGEGNDIYFVLCDDFSNETTAEYLYQLLPSHIAAEETVDAVLVDIPDTIQDAQQESECEDHLQCTTTKEMGWQGEQLQLEIPVVVEQPTEMTFDELYDSTSKDVLPEIPFIVSQDIEDGIECAGRIDFEIEYDESELLEEHNSVSLEQENGAKYDECELLHEQLQSVAKEQANDIKLPDAALCKDINQPRDCGGFVMNRSTYVTGEKLHESCSTSMNIQQGQKQNVRENGPYGEEGKNEPTASEERGLPVNKAPIDVPLTLIDDGQGSTARNEGMQQNQDQNNNDFWKLLEEEEDEIMQPHERRRSVMERSTDVVLPLHDVQGSSSKSEEILDIQQRQDCGGQDFCLEKEKKEDEAQQPEAGKCSAMGYPSGTLPDNLTDSISNNPGSQEENENDEREVHDRAICQSGIESDWIGDASTEDQEDSSSVTEETSDPSLYFASSSSSISLKQSENESPEEGKKPGMRLQELNAAVERSCEATLVDLFDSTSTEIIQEVAENEFAWHRLIELYSDKMLSELEDEVVVEHITESARAELEILEQERRKRRLLAYKYWHRWLYNVRIAARYYLLLRSLPTTIINAQPSRSQPNLCETFGRHEPIDPFAVLDYAAQSDARLRGPFYWKLLISVCSTDANDTFEGFNCFVDCWLRTSAFKRDPDYEQPAHAFLFFAVRPLPVEAAICMRLIRDDPVANDHKAKERSNGLLFIMHNYEPLAQVRARFRRLLANLVIPPPAIAILHFSPGRCTPVNVAQELELDKETARWKVFLWRHKTDNDPLRAASVFLAGCFRDQLQSACDDSERLEMCSLISFLHNSVGNDLWFRLQQACCTEAAVLQDGPLCKLAHDGHEIVRRYNAALGRVRYMVARKEISSFARMAEEFDPLRARREGRPIAVAFEASFPPDWHSAERRHQLDQLLDGLELHAPSDRLLAAIDRVARNIMEKGRLLVDAAELRVALDYYLSNYGVLRAGRQLLVKELEKEVVSQLNSRSTQEQISGRTGAQRCSWVPLLERVSEAVLRSTVLAMKLPTEVCYRRGEFRRFLTSVWGIQQYVSQASSAGMSTSITTQSPSVAAPKTTDPVFHTSTPNQKRPSTTPINFLHAFDAKRTTKDNSGLS